jgi:hypothetical protein
MFVNGVKRILPHLFCVAGPLSTERPVPRVWNQHKPLPYSHFFLENFVSLFFRSRKHIRSISRLFGGVRFRKFWPGFIGDDARELDQCQNGIGTGELRCSEWGSFRTAYQTHTHTHTIEDLIKYAATPPN